jgi:hypothetical protein
VFKQYYKKYNTGRSSAMNTNRIDNRLEEAASRLGWSRTVYASRRDVYLALITLAGSKNTVEVSLTDLAIQSRRSRPLVVQAVADLVMAGLVTSHVPIKDPQRQKPCRYELV